MHSNLDCAYAAGVMDSDGCFTILRRHERTNTSQAPHRAWYVASAQVNVVTPELCEWLKARWGGSIHVRLLRPDSRMGSLKPQYLWVLSAKALEPFLNDVQPYLVVKSRQCRLLRVLRALTFQRGRPGITRQRSFAALSALHQRIYEQSLALKRAA